MPGSRAISERTPLPSKFNLAVRSIPDGASIYLVGENKFLGTTDTYLPFEISDDKRVSLVFKKEGYQDETREVSPYPMLVQLKPLPEDDRRARKGGGRHDRPTSPDPEPTQRPTTTPPSTPPPGTGSGTGTTTPPSGSPQITPTPVTPPPVPTEATPPPKPRPRRQPSPNDSPPFCAGRPSSPRPDVDVHVVAHDAASAHPP